MTSFTTEQVLPFTFQVKDGRGRIMAVEGTPVASSSDETVATVTLDTSTDGKTFTGSVSSVAPGSGRVTVTADADLGAGVQEVTGILEYDVTLDPRTAERISDIEPGTPTDKAV